MTQGYGPDHGQQGQQGQWGQGGQNPPPVQPQWGQPSPASQPEWGQASQGQRDQGSPAPAATPGGYPGSAGYSGTGTGPQYGQADGVNWKRVKLIGLILLISTAVLLLVRLGINLATFIGAEDTAASEAGGEIGAVGIGSSLASLVLYILNFLVGLVMFVLGIVAAVMGRGRARVGGIVVAATIPVSVILYWVFTFVAGVIWGISMGASGATVEGSSTSVYYISAGTGVVHALLIVAILALGSFFVHSTASKKLSA